MPKSYDSFNDWTDEEVQNFLIQNEFTCFRKLNTGEWIGILPLMFTYSVCMDITPLRTFTYRWCFALHSEAQFFFRNAKEFDEVPSERSSLKGHRYITSPLYLEYDELGYPKW